MKKTKLSFNRRTLSDKSLKVIVGLFVVLVVLLLFGVMRQETPLITHSKANELYSQELIERVVVDGEYIYLETLEGEYKIYKNAINKTAFFTKYPVEVREGSEGWYEVASLVILVLSLLFLFRFMKQSRTQQIEEIRASRVEERESYESIEALTSHVTFEDVAGIKDVKVELEEIIDFLRDPKKYQAMDIRLPKGVLLVGPPGVGKTLISKAVAGEAQVPFFYQSGASFVHIYVGMGAKRVSELFKKAKQMAPSIIFIDEIDAVGKSRGEFRNDEREATLNQLLTEMDGFEESSGVIVIGATNKIEILDEALLRAGRFDRRIHISLPDLEERAKTLALYLAHKPHEVDIPKVARMTVGFNSAALDTLTNEAAIYAMRIGRNRVLTADFEAVKEKVLLGQLKISTFSDEEREIQAVYQGAKALIATWTDVEFEKIGIVTSRLVEQDHEILSRSQVLNRIKVHLAGSVATRMVYSEQFSNASKDIAKAKELATKLIYEYAMGENFVVKMGEEGAVLEEAQADVVSILEKLNEPRREISNRLMLQESITSEETREILRAIF